MSTARSDLAAGVINGILYSVGGYDGGFLNTIEAYDSTTNAWTAKEHLPTARQSLTIGVAGRRLYAAGGLQ
jgi:hypothetical protein